MTTSKTIYRTKYGPLMAGVHVAPFPYASQLKHVSPDKLTEYCLDQLDMLFKQQSTADETAAIIMEPILGMMGAGEWRRCSRLPFSMGRCTRLIQYHQLKSTPKQSPCASFLQEKVNY